MRKDTFIPAEAHERRRELTRGAWDLFERFCAYRNDETGLCCPSLETLASDLTRSYRHVSDMKSELVSRGWIRRTGRHSVDLLVGNFPAPIVREITPRARSSFGKNPNEGPASFGKNPNGERASFGKNPNGEPSPLTVVKEKTAAAAAARESDPLQEPVDERFLAEVIAAEVYSPELVRWVYGKLKLHALAAGSPPVKRQLLHWLGRETGSPPVQQTLFGDPLPAGAAAGNFGGSSPSDNEMKKGERVRPPDPECRLCRGAGEINGRACACVICAFCFGSGMEVIAGKGARRCQCRSGPVEAASAGERSPADRRGEEMATEAAVGE